MDHLCCLCIVFLMLLRLFIAALWSPAGKGADLLALVRDAYCILLLSHVVHGSGVVLDCILS